MDAPRRGEPLASATGDTAQPNRLAFQDGAEPVVDDLGQPIPARSFDASLDEETREFGSTRPPERLCMWCNAPLPDGDPSSCPSCGAALKPVEEDIAIVGLTVTPVDVRAMQAATAQALAAVVQSVPNRVVEGSEAGVQPPSPDVVRAMRLMELEALGVTVGEGGSEPAPGASEAGGAPAVPPATGEPAPGSSHDPRAGT